MGLRSGWAPGTSIIYGVVAVELALAMKYRIDAVVSFISWHSVNPFYRFLLAFCTLSGCSSIGPADTGLVTVRRARAQWIVGHCVSPPLVFPGELPMPDFFAYR